MEKPTYTAIDYNSKENKHNDNRIKILECALEDLERIKREGEPKLPPLTFEDEPINMY